MALTDPLPVADEVPETVEEAEPGAKAVPLIVPVPPTGGLLKVKVGPLV